MISTEFLYKISILFQINVCLRWHIFDWKGFFARIPCLKTCVTWYLHWTWVNQEDRFRFFSWHLNLILHKKRRFWLFNGFDVDIIKFSLLENLLIQIFIAFELQLSKKPIFLSGSRFFPVLILFSLKSADLKTYLYTFA